MTESTDAPAEPATPQPGPVRSSFWPVVFIAAVVVVIPVIGVGLLAGRSASHDAPAVTAATTAPASRPVLPPSSPAATMNSGARAGSKWVGSKAPLTYELAAERDVSVWTKRVRPVLGVRCLGGSTDVFVMIDWAASVEDQAGSHTVRVGFDEGADVEQRWLDSSDYRSLFAPHGEALAREIARSKRMRFAFTPYNAAMVVADFNVSGFDQLVNSIAKVCRWK